MPKDIRDIESALLKKGFRRREGGDAYFHLFVGGKKTPVFTKMSQGRGEVHDGLLSTMAKQLKLTKKDFMGLIDCPLSADEYAKLLRDGKHIA